jgi:hypothetical protein
MPGKMHGQRDWFARLGPSRVAVAGIANEFQSFSGATLIGDATESALREIRRTRRAGGVHAVENQINRATFAIETVVH